MVSRDQHSPQSSGMPEGKTVPPTDKTNEVGILQNRMGLSVYNPAKTEHSPSLAWKVPSMGHELWVTVEMAVLALLWQWPGKL